MVMNGLEELRDEALAAVAGGGRSVIDPIGGGGDD
jgi:hypothetical protein